MIMKKYLITLAVAFGLVPSIADASFQGHWPFQDFSASTVVSITGTTAVPGVLTSATNTATSSASPGPGTALTRSFLFDGVNDRVDATTGNTAILQNKGAWTLACWFKVSAANTTGDHRLMHLSGLTTSTTTRAAIQVNTGGQILGHGRAADGESLQSKTTTNSYDDDTWHHVAVVGNVVADTITIYVDGTSVAQTGTISFTAAATDNTASLAITFGSTGGGAEPFKGQIADCRIYDHELVSGDIATIISQRDLPTGVTIVQPAAQWKADEASGSLIDAVAAQDAVETSGTIAAATGKVSGARDYELGDTEYFEATHNSVLQTGDVPFAMSFWVHAESFPANAIVINKGWQAAGSANREYVLYFPQNTSIRFTVGHSGTSTFDHAYTYTFSTSTWYWIYMWHDPTANTLNIQVNNGPAWSTAHSVGLNAGTSNVQMGASPTQSLWFDGLIDDICYFKTSLPSDAQKALMYNYGNGLGQPWQSAGIPILRRNQLNMASLKRSTDWDRFKSQTPISLAN